MPPNRRHVHTRSIRVDAYSRDDGLWDLEATLTDTKSRDFPLATGVRAAGEPVHEMLLRVTIDTKLTIVDAVAESRWVPYPGHCDAIGPDYRKLIGLNLLQDFRRHLPGATGWGARMHPPDRTGQGSTDGGGAGLCRRGFQDT